MPDAYPLAWPLGRPRTSASSRKRAAFGSQNRNGYGRKPLSVAQARNRLFEQLNLYTRVGRSYRVDSGSIVLSTNVKTRRDGLPYSNAREPEDPGVAVYFELDGDPVCLPCDTFDRVADNIAAVAGHIEADRRQERYGVGSVRDRFAGFMALPAAGEGSGAGWWETLGVGMGASADEIRRAYRQRAKETHPDLPHIKDANSFRAVQEALRQGLDAARSRD